MILFSKIKLSGRKYPKIVWMFTAYVAVLLISVVVFFLTPDEYTASGSHLSINAAIKEGQQLYEAAWNGKVENIDDAYQKKTWIFDYSGDQLDLRILNGDVNGIHIFVQKKDMNDNKVKAVYYRTPASVAGMKIKIPSHPSLTLANHVLTIMKPEQVELKLTVFKKALPFTQFDGEEEKDLLGTSSASGNAVLYLLLPKNLELNAGVYSHSVEYVQDFK